MSAWWARANAVSSLAGRNRACFRQHIERRETRPRSFSGRLGWPASCAWPPVGFGSAARFSSPCGRRSASARSWRFFVFIDPARKGIEAQNVRRGSLGGASRHGLASSRVPVPAAPRPVCFADCGVVSHLYPKRQISGEPPPERTRQYTFAHSVCRSRTVSYSATPCRRAVAALQGAV